MPSAIHTSCASMQEQLQNKRLVTMTASKGNMPGVFQTVSPLELHLTTSELWFGRGNITTTAL